MADKIDALYDALKADGAVTKSREHFRQYIADDNNRRQLYEALKADGAIQSSNMTEFDNRLGLGVQPKSAGTSVGSVWDWGKGTMAKVKEAKRQKNEQSWLGRAVNKVEDAKEARRQKTAQAQAQTKPKQVTAEQATEDLWETVNRGHAWFNELEQRDKNRKEYNALRPYTSRERYTSSAHPGISMGGDAVRGKSRINPQTGKIEERWLRPDGTEYRSEAAARMAQYSQEKEQNELEQAYRERDRIDEMLKQRIEEMRQEDKDRPLIQSIGQELGLAAHSDMMPNITDPGYRWENDSEYRSLMAAARKNKALIQVLEDKRDNKMNEFWHSFGTSLMDGYTFSFGGKSNLDDVIALQEAQKDLPKINKKLQSGEKLTHDEEVSYTVLKNAEWNNSVQSQYGDMYGAWARAGKMGTKSLDFMLDFAMTGGIGLGKGIVGLTTKGLSKLFGDGATKGLGKFMTKTLGVGLGSMMTGATIANGIQLSKTTAKIGEKMLGDVYKNENGEYVFGHFEESKNGGEPVFVEGGNTFLGSLADAEREAISENGSEIIGEFLPGFGQALNSIGLSKVSRWLTSLQGKGWYKGYKRAMETIGFHGIPGEAFEEYAGTALDAIMGGDEWKKLGDQRTHVDIWLGCATMGAFLKAPAMLGVGFDTAQYYRYKSKVKSADKIANTKLGSGVWAPLRERIDGATNDQITDVAVDILNNEQIDKEGKRAALNYIADLQKMRGFSLGNIATEDRTDKGDTRQESPEEEVAHDANLNYAQGYNLEGESEMRSAKLGFDRATRALSDAGYDMNELEHMANDGSIYSALSSGVYGDQQEAVREWVVARATYEGMLGRVRDDIDNQVQASNEEIDQRVAKPEQGGDGMIHPAILKGATNEEGRPVHIIGGNVVMLDDGSGVDIDKSDKDILVRDPQTGKVEFVDIKDIANADAPLDAEQVKQETAAAITEQLATEAGDKMDGTVKVGNTYTVTDGEGLEHTITVLEDNGDGNLVVQEEGKEPYAMPMTYLQQMVDAEAMKQTEQGEGDNAQSMQNAQFTMHNAQSDGDNAQSDAGGETSGQTPTQESEQVGEQAEEESPEVKAHRELYGDERFDKTSADELVQNNINAAKKEVKKAEAEMKKPNLETDREKYLKKLEQRRDKLATAQANLDYWTKIQEVENARVQAEQEAAAAERAAQDEATYQQAVADEEAYQAEQLAKQQEQAERGPYTVGANIVEKWQQSPKVEGYENEITLPNGEKITGRYMLVESGTATPSHNANMEFVKNDGFPVDENGNTVNDRDYERDKDAQDITRQTASHYDARAIQNVPVVSNDGVVLGGNGRTMAGELAAEQGTDEAYVEHLTKYGRQFGFAPEQVSAMQHPRVVFVPDEALPYTTETFAKFNAQEMKGQNKTEQAVKLGKVVDDATFHRIINSINEFDTLGDFYADQKASVGAINELRDAGVINAMQYGEMFDGEKLSDAGRNMIENMLIGKAFESNPDAIRQLTKYKSLRQSVVNALAEISNNVGLGEDYSLEAELAEAIKLAYEARNAGRKSGEKVSAYARQMNLFAFDNGETVADYTNLTILMLADVLNDNRVNQLKKTLAMYNKEAQDNADGQMDIFSGGVKNKEDILNEILELLNYGTKEEIEKRLADANKRGAEQTSEEAGEQQSVDEAGTVGESGESEPVEQPTAETVPTAEVEQEEGDNAQFTIHNSQSNTDNEEAPTQQSEQPTAEAEVQENAASPEEKVEENEENSGENANFVLTLDALEASDLDEAVKSGARAWLQGEQTPANQLSYLIAEDYVRNRSVDNERSGSNAERAVEDIKQNKATAEQWKAMLTKAGGIKAGEDKWMGLSEWLDENKGKSLTKDEVLQFVRDNGVQMEEVNYGETSERIPEKIYNDFEEIYSNLEEEDFDGQNEMLEYAWGEYTSTAPDWIREAIYPVLDYNGSWDLEVKDNRIMLENNISEGDYPINSTRLDYTTRGLDNKREIAFVVPNVEPYQESDSIHFGPENEGKAVMWVRFGETKDVDGKRVLVIDEIQSNRHQDARKRGYTGEYAKSNRKAYRDALEAITAFNKSMKEKYGEYFLSDNLTQEESEEYDRLYTKLNETSELKDDKVYDVPDAPFEKNWHEVAMKRMLRLAAEEGFDKVAWTTGEQQAKRYDIGNAVREISSGITSDGERTMLIHLKSAPLMEFDFDDDGRIYRMNTEAQQYFSGAENISDVVGKEIASEALSIQGEGIGDVKKWSGDGLRIGGEGMKGFYDQMLPRFIDKYGKKWGVKTGTVELPNVEESGRTMHAVDVTPEMKESVMQGQPLFREVLSEGGELRILQDGSSTWRIEGMPGAYPSREAAIDAFREYAYGSIWDISDDGERIEVLGRGDMMAQMTGRTSKKDAARREKWAQERAKRSRKDIDNLCKRLGVQVNYVDDLSTAERGKLTERQQKAKGWYNPRTGEVWINMGNHNSYNDIMATFLHEVVAHKGLRKLFGEDFNTFLDNVYANADEGIRREIARMAARKGWDFREATEEYMARLAESMELDNPHKRGLWAMVKGFVIDQLRKLGVKGLSLSDNSLRYILWSSWHNMEQQGVLGAAEDVVMREQLGLLNAQSTMHNAQSTRGSEAAEGSVAEPQMTQDEFDEYMDAPVSTEELRDYLRSLKQKYGLKTRGVFHAIGSRADIEQMQGVIEDELYKELIKKFENPRIYGGHDYKTGMVFIFTDRMKTRREAEHNYWHEYGHEAFEALTIQEKAEYGLAALKWLKEKGAVDEDDLSHYSKDFLPNEGAARLIAYVYDNYGANNIMNGTFVGNEKIAKLAAAIQNYFKNGETKEDDSNRLRQYTEESSQPLSESRVRSVQEEREVRPESSRGDSQQTERGGSDTVAEGDDGLRYRDDESGDEDYDAGATTYEEGVTGALLKAASDNRAALSARVTAMRALGGNLSKLRSAMAQQREYDRKTVDAIVRLAKQVLNSGFFKSLSRYEVNRLMGMVNRAVGKEDITKQAGDVVDMLLDHQMKACADMLHKQISIRGSKLNAKGVEVQGVLDIKGQRMVEAMKEGMELDEESLGNRLSEVSERMGDDNKVVADNAAIEYQGLMLAKQYLEDIKSSEVEENELKKELRTAKEDKAAGRLDKDSYNEFVKDTGDAIRENRLERIEAYSRLMDNLGDGLKTSIERAKAWREANERRVREIQHDANSDLQGMEVTELGKMPEKRGVRHSIVQFLMQPLVTANEMLRDLGSKHVNGEGYLWNRFIGGWRAASDREQRKLQEAYDELADKVSTVMGKKMRWSDLFSMERKMEGMEVVMYDCGMPKSFHLTQGNMLYIYMVNKMTDGKMKLRRMGITEDQVEAIAEKIDPRFKELADWIQEEFLVNKREEYNEVYERMFGAPMAAIDNYITLNINDRSRGKQEDVSNYLDDDHIGSTITGSVIKRTRNAQAIDVIGTDAFDLVLDHLQKMEHWAAFGELNRDLGTLVSYKRFRNRLMQMKSTRFGTGKEYWNNFKTCCAILSGSYRPTRKSGVDDALVNIGKGVTASKIAFRLYTAFKQLLSSPAYLSEASIGSLIKNNPITGGAKAWNWAMKELPGFAERWNSRISGDSRLLDTESDWKWWHKGFVEKMNKWGMSPNAFVDAITVACGARAMYETKLRQNLAKGFTKEEARRRALRDASISYNETQQSSEDAFISAIQLDRTATSVAYTVFRNCSMGYQRRLFRAMKNLQRRMQKGYKEESIDFMTKQLARELGYQEVAELPAEAVEAVKKEYDKRLWRDMADVAIFGWVLQFAWNLGPYLAYLIGGDDDDDKLRMLSDAAIHALFGGVEGLTGGESISNYLNDKLQGKTKAYGASDYIKLMPMLSDVDSMLDHFDSGWALGATDLINLLVASSVGVNPQTISDVVVAIADACHGDMGAMQETGFALMRILQFPQKEVVDRFLVDELGITPEGADGIDAATLAQRYADYRRRRYAPLTGALYSEEQQEKVEQKGVKRFKSMVREKLENLSEDELLNWESDDEFLHDIWKKSMAKIVPDMSDESLRDAMESNDNIDVRKKVGNEIAKRVEPEDDKAKNPYGSDDAKYNQIYAAHQTWEDVAEDEILSYAERRLKKSDPVTSKRIAAARKRLTKVRARLANGYREDVMEAYREARRQVIEAFGL